MDRRCYQHPRNQFEQALTHSRAFWRRVIQRDPRHRARPHRRPRSRADLNFPPPSLGLRSPPPCPSHLILGYPPRFANNFRIDTSSNQCWGTDRCLASLPASRGSPQYLIPCPNIDGPNDTPIMNKNSEPEPEPAVAS